MCNANIHTWVANKASRVFVQNEKSILPNWRLGSYIIEVSSFDQELKLDPFGVDKLFFNNSNFFLDSVQLLCKDTIPGWQFEIIVRGLCPASFLVQQGKDDSTFQTETQKSWFNLSKDLIIDLIIDRLYIKKN